MSRDDRQQGGHGAFLNHLERVHEALKSNYSAKNEAFVRKSGPQDKALIDALHAWPAMYPQWTSRLEDYDSERYGPLLGVSDEGSAAHLIAAAAHASAKIESLGAPDVMTAGVIIDGERMTSAGEVPIGPDEYKRIIEAAFGRTHCTTNVGVRVNARLYQPLPEFAVADATANEQVWLDGVFERFAPFLRAPDGPRPLTVRLMVKPGQSFEPLRTLVPKIDVGRSQGKLGPSDIHCLSFLIEFENEIGASDLEQIRELIGIAAELAVREVAVDGEVLPAARRHLSIQGLLNVLSPADTRQLLAEASSNNVRIVFRDQVDKESAARTIWTGLHTARTHGMNAAKYGLVPLTLEEQEFVIRRISHWSEGWTAIPAFYVDTPLVTETDVYEEDRCTEAAALWMDRAAAAEAEVVLMDSPDRVRPRRLVRESADDTRGVLTLEQIEELVETSRKAGLKVLWSGGITPRIAWNLARLGVFGIFTTSSTARAIAVGEILRGDPQLPYENEPTEIGVRRVHALIQGGFLSSALQPDDSAAVEKSSNELLNAIEANGDVESPLASLDSALVTGWRLHWRL